MWYIAASFVARVSVQLRDCAESGIMVRSVSFRRQADTLWRIHSINCAATHTCQVNIVPTVFRREMKVRISALPSQSLEIPAAGPNLTEPIHAWHQR